MERYEIAAQNVERHAKAKKCWPGDNDFDDAAFALREAASRITELETALRPFAAYMGDKGDLDNLGQPLPDEQGVGWVYLTMGDFRRARSSLTEAKP